MSAKVSLDLVNARRHEAVFKFKEARHGKMLDRLDPLSTAIHEGAHAVFDEAFGLTVLDATCYPPPTAPSLLGLVQNNADQVVLPKPLIVVKTLAGDRAEHYFNVGGTFDPELAIISGSDQEDLVPVLRSFHLPPEALREVLQGFLTTTDYLVRGVIAQIMSVAAEMYAYGPRALPGDYVRRVIDAAEEQFAKAREGKKRLLDFKNETTKLSEAVYASAGRTMPTVEEAIAESDAEYILECAWVQENLIKRVVQ
jgi:hypothetical protein